MAISWERSGSGAVTLKLPSDTKLSLTNNGSEINIFENYEFHTKFLEKSFFPRDFLSRDFEGARSLQITKNNSHGIVFVISGVRE